MYQVERSHVALGIIPQTVRKVASRLRPLVDYDALLEMNENEDNNSIAQG